MQLLLLKKLIVINNYDDENNDNHRDSRSNRDIEYTTISDAKYGMKKKASVKIANYILVFFIQIVGEINSTHEQLENRD
ncbi:unnamed protein product [Rhizophagus irregularis]|nr:unnamed protein product [Rhizophagus irregularis]